MKPFRVVLASSKVEVDNEIQKTKKKKTKNDIFFFFSTYNATPELMNYH